MQWTDSQLDDLMASRRTVPDYELASKYKTSVQEINRVLKNLTASRPKNLRQYDDLSAKIKYKYTFRTLVDTMTRLYLATALLEIREEINDLKAELGKVGKSD